MKILRLLPLLLLPFIWACSSDDDNDPGQSSQLQPIIRELEKTGGISDFTTAFKNMAPGFGLANEKLTILAARNKATPKESIDNGGYTAEVLKRHIIKGAVDVGNFTGDSQTLKSIANDDLIITKKDGKVLVNGIPFTSTNPDEVEGSYIYIVSEPIPVAGVEPEPNPEPIPTYLHDGVTIISEDSLGFVLFAPGKQSVHLIGSFNDWTVSDKYKMAKSGDRFYLKVGDLKKGQEYICQYLIDNQIRIADPYSTKISDPGYDNAISASIYPGLIKYPTGKTTEIAMVVNTAPASYSWKVSDFRIANPDNMVIYEILIRDFTEARSIKAVQEKIRYLKDLGVNAIELMPFNEFEGNNSWGYNPSFYFATDKAYGTANDYKAFIDACHQNGMAVIMDMVLNHSYGQSPMVRMYQDASGNPTPENPWYNVKSPNETYSWGSDFNHESKYTQAFVDSVCSYWMKEYKVDGFRFDFTKGFTNKPGDGWAKDDSRIAILERMTREIYKRNPNALVIFEHLTDNSEETILADFGIKLWGNLNYNFNEATMGWGAEPGDYGPKGDVTWGSYQARGWTKPNLVTYMESHDEERIMFKNKSYGRTEGSYDIKDLATGLKRSEMAAVILMSIPGPKMIWQFGELGYDYELNDDRLAPKPVRWDYLEVPERKALYNVFAKMNNLRNTNTIFSTTNYTTDLVNQYKQLLLKSGNEYACVIANFDVKPVSASVNFGKAGTWTEYFTNSTFTTTSDKATIELQPGEYRLYLGK